jgi:hypothetical protein
MERSNSFVGNSLAQNLRIADRGDARVRVRVFYSSASTRVSALAAVLSRAALPYSSSWQVRAARLGRGVARVGGVRTATSVRKREWRRSFLLFARMRAVFRFHPSLPDRLIH